MTYSGIYIIYNPNSTGDSSDNAQQLRKELKSAKPEWVVELKQTKYAGHAEKIAYQLAKKAKRPLLVSASGDGGYAEVVNSAVQAQKEGAKPICAVLASGNANDHSRTVQKGTLAERIIAEKITQIDLLKLDVTNKQQSKTKYAHSYIGMGLTPKIAIELNKTDLNPIKEAIVVTRAFMKYRPFRLQEGNKIVSYDSLIFANIREMAKVLTISNDSKVNDGLFEIARFRHMTKFDLLKKFIKAAANNLDISTQNHEFRCTAVENMVLQLDGEILKVQKGSDIAITSKKKYLRTVI